MAQPLVSVIMPTYNHASFIKEAIDSVLGQSYQELELIIVDNFSEDRTQDIIRSCKDARVRYFQFRNQGVIAASRNFGIRQSKGEYIAFIDSDDLWQLDKLTQQLRKMEDDRQAGISCGQLQVVSDDQSLNGHVRGPKDRGLKGNIYDRLLKFNFILSSSVVVRRSVLDEVGSFDESKELVAAEDYDLWLRICHKYGALIIPKVLGKYRHHGSNTSSDGRDWQRISLIIDRQRQREWITEAQANRARANFAFHIGWPLIDRAPEKARFYFKKAIGICPQNIKICFVSVLGIMLTFIPFIFRVMKRNRWDKKLARRILNPQNL